MLFKLVNGILTSNNVRCRSGLNNDFFSMAWSTILALKAFLLLFFARSFKYIFLDLCVVQ